MVLKKIWDWITYTFCFVLRTAGYIFLVFLSFIFFIALTTLTVIVILNLLGYQFVIDDRD